MAKKQENDVSQSGKNTQRARYADAANAEGRSVLAAEAAETEYRTSI